jgi:hypothetical protein
MSVESILTPIELVCNEFKRTTEREIGSNLFLNDFGG